ncbi:hypothetical protein BCEP4_2220002 [Burkholderia cepacia]|nr:hypothetical protein BCEP4_2220002 [Burkholderia cepacia]
MTLLCAKTLVLAAAPSSAAQIVRVVIFIVCLRFVEFSNTYS